MTRSNTATPILALDRPTLLHRREKGYPQLTRDLRAHEPPDYESSFFPFTHGPGRSRVGAPPGNQDRSPSKKNPAEIFRLPRITCSHDIIILYGSRPPNWWLKRDDMDIGFCFSWMSPHKKKRNQIIVCKAVVVGTSDPRTTATRRLPIWSPSFHLTLVPVSTFQVTDMFFSSHGVLLDSSSALLSHFVRSCPPELSQLSSRRKTRIKTKHFRTVEWNREHDMIFVTRPRTHALLP